MRARLIRRLTGYWQMEAANVLLVPGAAAGLVAISGDGIGPGMLAAMLGCGGLLLIGAGAWRLELAELRRRELGEAALAARLTRLLGPSRPLGLALGLLGAGGGIAELALDGALTASAIAALILGLLALLEYVNYYVAQLQHFDHGADFRRLLAGKGGRTPHLAKVVAAWRAREG